jgi:hypothetical protein
MHGRYSSSLTKCLTLFFIYFSHSVQQFGNDSQGWGRVEGMVGWGGGGYGLRDWVGEGR